MISLADSPGLTVLKFSSNTSLKLLLKRNIFTHCSRKVMSDGNKNITFTNIMGQGRINQLGGVFINGRPLPQHIRIKIIEMASSGIKPCNISRQLRVSHGAVSKILNRYVETGSVSPGQIGGNPRSRLAIQAVEKHILALKAKYPNLCASELRSCLIEQEICSPENAPTVSSINRPVYFCSQKHIRSKKLNNSNEKERKTTKKNCLSHSIEHILGLHSVATYYGGDEHHENDKF
uniref:Paired domain-containing protein n=1 Tax=Elaeophora elaphi TaxID=1147741 RepID=A0A0R3RI84_9BILA